MRPTVFICASSQKERGRVLSEAMAAVKSGVPSTGLYLVRSRQFAKASGSPFAYWLGSRFWPLFEGSVSLESGEVTVRVGAQTSDDFHYVRVWWEVKPVRVRAAGKGGKTGHATRWVPFANNGVTAEFYADVPQLLDWGEDGEDLSAAPGTYLRNRDFYFQAGLFQPRRSTRLAPRAVPSGCIPGQNGFQVFGPRKQLMYDLGLLNSGIFAVLHAAQVGSAYCPLYIPGPIQRTPIPSPSDVDGTQLAELSLGATAALQHADAAREVSHVFVVPSLVTCRAASLAGSHELRDAAVRQTRERVAHVQAGIDHLCLELYGLHEEDVCGIASGGALSGDGDQENGIDDSIDQNETLTSDFRSEVHSLLSYAVGCAFGRWDIRYATGEKTAPELPDPFAPLPVCSPGMLQDEDGLPLTGTPSGYPLRINWNGILVDESNHADDVLKRVREILHLLWSETSDSIEAEMCAALGVKELRDYFRKLGSGGFSMDHVHMYSKSHRKAPIYWLLQSSHKNYGVWLYYQRLDSDLLFKVLQNYVEPKLKLEQNHEAEASHKLTAGGLSVSETRQAQKDLEKQQDLVAEIREFRDTLKKAADLRLTPDLDDGVVLNIAPLHDLVPWSEASKYWNEILAGKYPWSSVGKQLEQKGMV